MSADTHRLLPQSPDAERGVISSMMIQGAELIEELDSTMKPEMFHVPAHATIFGFMVGLVREKKPVDFISLTQILRDRGALDEVGGAAFVTELFTFIPSAKNAMYYAGIVIEKYTLRRLICTANEITRRVYDCTDQSEAAELLDAVQGEILEISEQNSVEETWRGPKEGVYTAIEALEAAYKNRGGIMGLSTGLVDLDRMLGGMKPKQSIVIAGSAGMGKTALALNIAKHLAVREKIPVGFISLEMSYEELMARGLHEEARVSLQRARDGFMKDGDFGPLAAAAARLAEAPLYVDDAAAVNVFDLKAKCRRAIKKFKAQVIFVDYLQLLEGSEEEKKNDNRQLEIARISRTCKVIAKGLNITMVLLAQLNRKGEERNTEIVINPEVIDEETKRPRKFKRRAVPELHDLRESGAIEQDADVVLMPYRPWYVSRNEYDLASEKIEWASIFVRKQRNGPIGQIICQYVPDETRFQSLPDAHGNERPLFSNNQERRQVVPASLDHAGTRPEQIL